MFGVQLPNFILNWLWDLAVLIDGKKSPEKDSTRTVGEYEVRKMKLEDYPLPKLREITVYDLTGPKRRLWKETWKLVKVEPIKEARK